MIEYVENSMLDPETMHRLEKGFLKEGIWSRE
jgi:hypothetical protein